MTMITVTTRRGRARHALPETGGERTMCGRAGTGIVIDDALPDCKRCLRAIAIRIEEMGE